MDQPKPLSPVQAAAAILGRPIPPDEPELTQEQQWQRDDATADYCRECKGTGIKTWQENQAPCGSGMYWPETFNEVCPDCIGQNLCPHCRMPLETDELGYLIVDSTCGCGFTLEGESYLCELLGDMEYEDYDGPY